MMVNDAPKQASAPDTGSGYAGDFSGDRVGSNAERKSSSQEQQSYWLWGEAVWIRFTRLDIRCPVVRLSATEAWFEPDYRQPYAFREQVEIFIRHGERKIGPLLGVIAYQAMAQRGPVLGLVFQNLSSRWARELLKCLGELESSGFAKTTQPMDLWAMRPTQWARVREVIEKAEKVNVILHRMVGTKAIAHPSGGAMPVAVHLISVDGGQVRWRPDQPMKSAPVRIDLVSVNSVYRLAFDTCVEQEGDIITSIPRQIERIRYHLIRHGILRQRLTVGFTHPLWPNLPPMQRDVQELSQTELTFTANADEDLLYPGLNLPSVEVSDSNGMRVHVEGQLRAVTSMGDALHLCKVEVKPPAAEDEHLWDQLVSNAQYGPSRDRAPWSKELWNLFATSGYFNLSGKSPEQFDHLKKSYFRIVEHAAELSHLMHIETCVSEGEVEGSLSISKAYHGTWLLHHLAKKTRASTSKVNSRQVLRDIYTGCLEHAQRDPDLRWVIIYLDATVGWHHRSHFEFARKHERTNLIFNMPFQLTEADTDESEIYHDESFSQMDILPATAAEQSSLVQSIRTIRPIPYLEALDLVPERFLTPDFGAHWHQSNFERERTMLVSHSDGQPVAAAVLETGQLGTHLFKLLDSVRLYPMRPGGEGAYAALIHAAQVWFRKRGRASFIYFREHEDVSATAQVRLRDLGEGRLWIIGASLVPAFKDHIHQVTAPKGSRT